VSDPDRVTSELNRHEMEQLVDQRKVDEAERLARQDLRDGVFDSEVIREAIDIKPAEWWGKLESSIRHDTLRAGLILQMAVLDELVRRRLQEMD
jgi:hypothetical protein